MVLGKRTKFLGSEYFECLDGGLMSGFQIWWTNLGLSEFEVMPVKLFCLCWMDPTKIDIISLILPR